MIQILFFFIIQCLSTEYDGYKTLETKLEFVNRMINNVKEMIDTKSLEKSKEILSKLILIDEDDPKWNIILNYFAPRLSALYNNDNGKNLCTLLSRIEKQREQYRQNNNKTITHDMTPEQMEKMGIELKSEQFKEATTRIKSINIKQSPTNIVDDTKQSI